MEDYTTALLAAERRGRALAAAVRPNHGDVWDLCIGHGADACALMAAGRWAARLGADVGMRLPADRDADPVWLVLAESSRRLGFVHFEDNPSETTSLRFPLTGGDITLAEIPRADAAWRTPIAESAPMIRPVHAHDRPMSRERCRRVDRTAIDVYAVPGLCLMENAAIAGVAVAMDMLARVPDRRVLVLAGGGNNGGDGFAVARGLHCLGADVDVALLKPAESLTGDARANFMLLGAIPDLRVLPLDAGVRDLPGLMRGRDLIVDALLGTGFSGELSPLFRTAVAMTNDSGVPVLALDIPSGLDGDSGAVGDAAIVAAATVTFAAMKSGLAAPGAAAYTGRLFLGDIGAPGAAFSESDA